MIGFVSVVSQRLRQTYIAGFVDVGVGQALLGGVA